MGRTQKTQPKNGAARQTTPKTIARRAGSRQLSPLNTLAAPAPATVIEVDATAGPTPAAASACACAAGTGAPDACAPRPAAAAMCARCGSRPTLCRAQAYQAA